MSDFTVGPFFATLGFYLLWLLVILFIWNFLWLKPFPLTLPDPNPSNPEAKISNVFQAMHYIYRILFSEFSADFWLKFCGFEAFAYISFIRKMLKVVAIFFFFSFLFGVPYSLGYSNAKGDILNSFNLDDDLYKYYFQMVFLILFSALYYMSLFSLKNFLSDTHRLQKSTKSQKFGLQDKTLRFKGVLKSYQKETLLQKIREMLPENEKGSIVDILIIPNTANLLNLECKRQILLLRKDHLLLKNQDLETLQIIEKELEIIKERGFVSSGNAILCVDSTNSYKALLEKFSMLSIPFWRNFCHQMKFKCSRCFGNCECCGAKMALLPKEDHEGILAYPLPCPEDISWRNLHNETPISSLKRVGWNFLAVLMMVFFTTPASLITVLGLTELITAIIHNDAPEPGDFSSILEKNLSPLLIILINQLLLLIINTIALMKRHIRISKTQMTIFDACFLYLLFNSFLIPALSMTTVESIFSFLSNESKKVDELLETFYLQNTGSLFVILLIQSGVFSFSLYVLQLPDLCFNMFSRRMVVAWRNSRIGQEVWRKDERDNFQYGYFYAINIVFLIIVLVFSTTVPAISVSGMIYFFLRGVSDSWDLITCHRKEMDSNGKIIDRVISFCCFGGILFELLIIIYYSVSQLKYNVIIMVLIFMASIFMIWRIEGVKINREIKEDGRPEGEEVKEWVQNYKHPLVEFLNEKDEIL